MKKWKKFLSSKSYKVVGVMLMLGFSTPLLLAGQSKLISKYFTTSDGVKLHYIEVGSGPTLVLVPGWTMPAWIWQPQLEYFAGNYRVVALDPRGQGQSEKPGAGYHSTRRAQDIYELLKHLDREPVVLTGWSLAVQEVMVCANEFGSELIKAIVLVDHPVNLSQQDSERVAADRIQKLQLDRSSWTRSFIEAIHQTPQSEMYFDSLTKDVLTVPTNAAAMMITNLHFIGPNDLRPMVNSLGKPILFIYSSLDWAVEAAEEVRENWPEAPVEIIDQTSHTVFRDRPQEFNQVLESFMVGL